MAIDYGTPTGKLRYRLADLDEAFPLLPDSVYETVYAEQENNLNRATKALGSMILGQLSFKTRREIGLQLVVYGNQYFEQYKEFLVMTVKDPAFADSLAITAYGSATNSDNSNPILQFLSDWKKNYAKGDESQQLANNALVSPNDGSVYGTGVVV